MKDIAEQIKMWLTVEGKKQWELAQILNVPAPTVNRWLNGKAKVSNAYVAILKSKGIIRE